MHASTLALADTVPDYDLRRREHLACGWLPPKWDWVDPMKDARAEIEQIDAGLKSRTQALAERGYDAEQVDAEIAADRARENSLGLTFSSTASAPAIDGAAANSAATEDAAADGTAAVKD
jgi:capsid protein